MARKRREYLECVSLYYDIPDSERSDDEITMLRQVNFGFNFGGFTFFFPVHNRLTVSIIYNVLFVLDLQIAVDCPRTVPDVTFFQHALVQKSLERILYTWLDSLPLLFCSGHI